MFSYKVVKIKEVKVAINKKKSNIIRQEIIMFSYKVVKIKEVKEAINKKKYNIIWQEICFHIK